LAANVRHDSRVHFRALAFLDPLLARAALIVKGDDILGGARHVGDDEADARIEFARMPFDLGDDAARPRPGPRLIGKICIGTPHFVRRSPNRARQKMANPLLQDAICRQSDRVFDPLGFEELVNIWIGEGGVSPEINARDLALVSFDNRGEHALPPIGAMNVARAHGAAFQIAKLVENEQRMITGAVIVTVPDAHLLLAMGRTDARIHVEQDTSRRTAVMHAIDPLACKIGESG
jgi:hypothetical protein